MPTRQSCLIKSQEVTSAKLLCGQRVHAHGISGLDAHTLRRVCTAFKSTSDELCNSLALLVRRLRTCFVHPDGIAPFLTCRLIALDKCPGVRLIGICD